MKHAHGQNLETQLGPRAAVGSALQPFPGAPARVRGQGFSRKFVTGDNSTSAVTIPDKCT